ADTLGYLSQEGLYWFEKKGPREWFCDACFTGEYPIRLLDHPDIYEMACARKKGACACAS
ncbi:MAG: hypothetical protein JW706_03830, partial [Opitutales bacterium]|nr:hypothetical protein [Opitutales bacterium]